MLEDKLKEIIIVKEETREILAIIPNKQEKKELIQANGIDIILNYTDKEIQYTVKDGKVFLKD